MYASGASAFICKNADLEQTVGTIKLVHENKLNMAVQEPGTNYGKESKEEKLRFSRREFEIAALICQGKSNKEIADKLHITNKTVEAHKKNSSPKQKHKALSTW